MARAVETREDRPPAEPLGRIDTIDILRGLVMVLMALDHVRDYFHAAPAGLDPTDPAQSHLLLYATRWITYLCAPTFVLLTGLSAWLRGAAGGDKAALSLFLFTRGLWLILLELTLVGTGFTFHPFMLFLQIIWVIGIGLVVLAVLCRLPAAIVLAIGLAVVAGHDLLDPLRPPPGGQASWFDFLDGRFAFATIGPLKGVLLYSALGWVGILLAGYGMGPLFRLPAERRARILTMAGAAMVAAFILLRLVNVYGDPAPWTPQPDGARTLIAFLRVSKYPPSLDFALATLGPMVALLPWLDRLPAAVARVLRTFGRVPFFYYLLHIYLIHGAAAALGMMEGLPFARFTDPLNRRPASASRSGPSICCGRPPSSCSIFHADGSPRSADGGPTGG